MKNIIFTISVFLFLSFAAIAQTNTEKKAEWVLFTPKNENFSVEIPNSLLSYSFGEKSDNRRYSGLFEGTYFFIFSDPLKSDEQYKTALKFAEINQKKEFDKQLISNIKNFNFTDDENFHHIIYSTKNENRAYIFHLVTEKKNDPNVKRFFENLKIDGQAALIKIEETQNVDKTTGIVIKEPVKIDKSSNSEQSKIVSGRGQGSGAGNGSESGQGSGLKIENQSISEKNKNAGSESRPLKLTSKPKPQYTDFARFYEITGDVRMRVTFLPSGNIGSTSPATKLPFGLTKQAITAAKQIRFEPQINKGVGVAVTKVVVYTFTIF